MLPKTITTSLMALLVIFAGAVAGQAQSIDRDYGYGADDYDRVKIDRHLDVEVWTDHYDGEYYDGDNIVVYFRASRDAFVSIYSIDTRGRVVLLFPTDPTEDNYIRGGVTYSLPGEGADFDLEINGPEGFENIQIIASRERFDIPNWYRNSGLVCDWDDRSEYMDFLNANHFVRYSGQRFAYDRAVVYVNEWEPDYYRPIYYPYYPSWTVYGNCYVDYPWGASVYVNGIYWGCAPLYIPRIAVGWHVVTIYDRYGHCWESDFHISRYNTVVFDRHVVVPSPSVKSKFKEVRSAGYRNPVTSGYPDFKAKNVVNNNVTINNTNNVVGKSGKNVTKTTMVDNSTHKYVRGSTRLVKTDRGYETDASSAVIGTGAVKGRTGSTSRIQNPVKTTSGNADRQTVKSGSTKSTGSSYRNSSGSNSSGSSGYYQKKSGSSSKRSVGTTKSSGKSSSSGNTVERRSPTKTNKSSSSSGTYKKQSTPSQSGKSSGTVKSAPSKAPSSSGRSAGSSKVKSSSSNDSGGSGKSTKSSPSPKSNSTKKSRR